MTSDPKDPRGGDRLLAAERRGLRIAIACRTAAVTAALVWYVTGSLITGVNPTAWGLGALAVFAALGFFSLAVIGTRYNRWWLKYLLSAADILGICALFVVVPLSRGGDVPQIIVFRAYGIYFLFPLIALAALSLTWQLVAWSGLVAVSGWWSAFFAVIHEMPNTLSWKDLPAGATAEEYLALILSADFIGVGNRIQETGFLMIASLTLAVAVGRARQVFLAQMAAEAEREAERVAREKIAVRFGRFLPEVIANKLVEDEGVLAPSVRYGVVLVMDIRDFTSFGAGKDPADVIAALDAFLASASDVVSNYGGVVISFTGDGLLATFNIPIEVQQPERAGLSAASALVEEAHRSGFSVRIGLAAGNVASGSIGSDRRQSFTVYGETVNLAARLEQLGKTLGHTILLDEATARRAQDGSLVRIGQHMIRGLPEPVQVFSASEQACT